MLILASTGATLTALYVDETEHRSISCSAAGLLSCWNVFDKAKLFQIMVGYVIYSANINIHMYVCSNEFFFSDTIWFCTHFKTFPHLFVI